MTRPSAPASHIDSDTTTGNTPQYACFDSTVVLICGYPADVTQQLAKQVEAQGGRVMTRQHPRALPHMVICGTAADATYKEIRKAHHTIPAVTLGWVEACIKSKKQVDYRPYQLKPLTGINACITNFDSVDRAPMQAMLENAGANFSAEMFKGRCTHLVCQKPGGNKYKGALDWRNVHIVSPAWVTDSINLGYPTPEGQYMLTGPAAATAAAPVERAAAQPAAPILPQVVSDIQQQKQHQQRPQQQQQQQQRALFAEAQQPDAVAKGCSTKTRSCAAVATATQNMAATIAAAGAGAAAAPLAVTMPNTGSRDSVLAETTDSRQAVSAAAAAAAGQASFRHRLQSVAADSDSDDAPMFLERVVLWWCGVAAVSDEYYELQGILHRYAGVRFPDLCDATTHIMVGTRSSSSELATVRQYLQSCRRRIEVVKPGWLRQCHEQQQLVLADAQCRMNLDSFFKHAAISGAVPASNSGQGNAADNGLERVPSAFGNSTGSSLQQAPAAAAGGIGAGVFSQSASRQGFPASTTAAVVAAAAGGSDNSNRQGQEWIPEFWREQPSDGDRLFEGCHFTLVALQNKLEYQREYEAALRLIRHHGGQIFTANSVKPPPSCPKIFAVCPPSLPQPVESSLLNDASFKMVHLICRVTPVWMDMCDKRKELIRPSPRLPLLAPLRHTLPLPGFESVKVAVTGYTTEQRETISTLVKLLGGTFTQTMANKNMPTHLILPRWGPDPATAADAIAGPTSSSGGGSKAGSSNELPDLTVNKIIKALRHNVVMVVSEWLLECASEGRKLPGDSFKPVGDLQQLLQLQQHGCMQVGLPSQLPQTQVSHGTQQQRNIAASQVRRIANGTAGTTAAAAANQAANACASGMGKGNSPPAPTSNWFNASSASSQQQQRLDMPPPMPQQPVQQTKQQQPQHNTAGTADQQPGPTNGSDQRSRQQPQQQPQQEHSCIAGQAREAQGPGQLLQPFLQEHRGNALADVANVLHCSPPQSRKLAGAAVAHQTAKMRVAVQSVVTGTTAPAAVAGVPSKPEASPLSGSDEQVLAGLDDLVNTMHSKDFQANNASQAMPADMLQGLAASLAGSGGAAAGSSLRGSLPGSGSNAGGSGYSLRNKRKTAGSGNEDSKSGGSEPQNLPRVSGPAAATKRPRRSNSGSESASKAAGAMPPPARVQPESKGASATGEGGAATATVAAAAAAGHGGNRYGTRRTSAIMAYDITVMSQQVGYDTSELPEQQLSGRPDAKKADEATRRAILARVSLLPKAQKIGCQYGVDRGSKRSK